MYVTHRVHFNICSRLCLFSGQKYFLLFQIFKRILITKKYLCFTRYCKNSDLILGKYSQYQYIVCTYVDHSCFNI